MTDQKPTTEAIRVAVELVNDWSSRDDVELLKASGAKAITDAIAAIITAKDAQLTAKDVAIKNLTDALQDYEEQVLKLEGYLERAGWRRCDIAACNCNGYHNWNPSRTEIEEPLREQNEQQRALLVRLVEFVESIAQPRCSCPVICRCGATLATAVLTTMRTLIGAQREEAKALLSTPAVVELLKEGK